MTSALVYNAAPFSEGHQAHEARFPMRLPDLREAECPSWIQKS
jgi:hypothetical protein